MRPLPPSVRTPLRDTPPCGGGIFRDAHGFERVDLQTGRNHPACGAKITIAPSKTASSDAVIINILETNVDNPLDLSGGSVTNAPGDPAKLFFFYGGTGDISLTGAADSYGIVYAPNAGVKLSGQADWYGALVVKTLESTGGSALHYDRNLGR